MSTIINTATPSTTAATDPPPRDPSGVIKTQFVTSDTPITRGSDVVADDSSLYWFSPGTGIMRLAKAGGGPELIMPVPLTPDMVASRAPGGAPVRAPSTLDTVTAIAASASHVAWATHDAMKVRSILSTRDRDGVLHAIAIEGAMVTSIAIDREHAYVATSGPCTATDGKPPNRVTTRSAAILRVRLASNAVEIVQEGLDGATKMALDATHLYTTQGQSRDVVRLLKEPKVGAPIEVLAKAQETLSGLAVDDRFVFYATTGRMEMPKQAPCKTPPCPAATSAPILRHSELRRVPKVPADARSGSVPLTLASELRSPGVLGETATLVVFQAGAGLFTIPKNGKVSPSLLVDLGAPKRDGHPIAASLIEYVAREETVYFVVKPVKP